MRALYVITAELASILDAVDDGEVPENLEELLEALTDDMDDKLTNCVLALRNLDAEATTLRAEAQRIGKRASAAAKASERLERYIIENMQKVGWTKFDAGSLKARIQQNSVTSAEFSGDPAVLPAAFKRFKVELNREAAREAAKRGETLPDGVTVTKGQHLRIV